MQQNIYRIRRKSVSIKDLTHKNKTSIPLGIKKTTHKYKTSTLLQNRPACFEIKTRNFSGNSTKRVNTEVSLNGLHKTLENLIDM